MEQLIKDAESLMYSEVERTSIPAKGLVDIAVLNGIRIAGKLGANVSIVHIALLLIDCQIGQAASEGRVNEHVAMSLEKANQLLTLSTISEIEKDNIRHCILEHHGTEKFYSSESEIVCNADCYKFASVPGFLIGMRYTRDMSFSDLIKLQSDKLKEKTGALSLHFCKQELQNDVELINRVLGEYKKYETDKI